MQTRKPDLRGLDLVLYAAAHLHGERHAPNLPIPASAVRGFAERYRLSGAFVTVVQAYDIAVLTEASNLKTKHEAQLQAHRGRGR